MAEKRKVAIIGAGLAGTTAALGFAKAGFDVTLYSNRDRETLRNRSPMTGNALYFGKSLGYDAEIIEDIYAPQGDILRGNLRLYSGSGEAREHVLELDATFPFHAQGVDLRLRTDDRLEAFLALGGQFRVQEISPEDLDAIAGQSDLTLVATGKKGLVSLFPVNEERTHYHEPQRHLLLVTLKGLDHSPETFAYRGGGKSNFNNFDTSAGETSLATYLHKDVGPAWTFLGFAKPGGPWVELFGSVSDAKSARDAVVDLFSQWFPEDAETVAKLQPIAEDPYSWLTGAVTPTVRQAVGRTASGHPVAAIGDAVIAVDPIAGQGAQGASVQIALLLRAARNHPGAFTEQWLNEQFDRYWQERGEAATELTRFVLGDPKYASHAELLFPAAAVNAEVAKALFNFYSEPQKLLGLKTRDAILDFIADQAGEPAQKVLDRFRSPQRFSSID